MRPVFGGGTVSRLIDPGSHSVAIILQFAEVTTRVGRHSELPRLNFSINDPRLRSFRRASGFSSHYVNIIIRRYHLF